MEEPKEACLRCGASMIPLGIHKIQLGEAGPMLGNW